MKNQILMAMAIMASAFISSCNNESSSETASSEDVKVEEAPKMENMNMDTAALESPMMTSMHSMMEKMNGMKMSGKPDSDFAMMMIEHHQGAIDMAAVEIASGKDAQLKAMAEKMAQEQKKEIQKLQEFAKEDSHSHEMKKEDADAFSKLMMGSMEEMHNSMDGMTMNGDVDVDFASMMIPHHKSAIDMSKAVLKYGTHQEIKTMAQKMITDQEKEIAELKSWLSQK